MINKLSFMHCFILKISLFRLQRYNKYLSFCYLCITKMIIFTLFILNQFRFQNSGLNKSNTVNSSKRPNSMRKANNHLAAMGKALQE